MNYCVYLHRNIYNQKVYIGITKYGDSPNKRWCNGNGYMYNETFYKDIMTYGWLHGFEHIILQNNLTEKQARQLEKQYIQLYDSGNPSKGYNIMSMASNHSCSKNSISTDSRVFRSKYYLPSKIMLVYNDSDGLLRTRIY